MSDGSFSLDEALGRQAPSAPGPFSLDDALGRPGPAAPPPRPAPAQPSIWDRLPSREEVGRQLGMGVGHIVDSAGAAVALFANPLNQAVNAALPGDPLATNVGEGWSESLGLPQPQTRTERLIKDVAVGAGAGLFTAGGAEAGLLAARAPSLGRSFLQFLADAPVVNTVAGATGGGSAGAAREAGAGPVGQSLAGLAGGFAGGAAAYAAGIRAQARARGVNLDHVPDEQLVSGALDDVIGDTGLTPADVDAILQGVGADAAQFSSPETAAAAAARARGAQATPAPNFEGLPAPGRSKRSQDAYGQMLEQLNTAREQGALPPRVLPDDVSIIAAPEGAIRSDDVGGMVGVERSRAANEAVLGEAQSRVASDPLVASILDSNLSPQMKVRSIWDRIERMNAAEGGPDLPDVPASPFMAPTPDAAAAGVGRAANPSRSRIHDITAQTESRNRDVDAQGRVVTSSAGAKGRMQVMDGTNRDPGYGVRPAANDSLEERARVGRDYIDALQRHYGGDMRKAWAAYNAGPGALDGAIAKHGAAWLDHMPAETRAYVNKNMAALGGRPEPLPYRAADYSAAQGGRDPAYGFDAFDAGDTLRRNTTFNRGEAEVPESFGQRQAREAESGPFATGGSTRPFRASPDDAEWQARAQATADELFTKAQEDLERRWQAREQARQEREQQRGADERFERERTRTEETSAGDPASFYRGKYDQKPSKAGEFWATTAEGYVAGKAGQPVAFRNAREAARWAAGEKLGGDFEFVSWGGQDRKGNQRVVLRRREGSTYGEPPAPTPATPPAGRSTDESQRQLAGPRAETPPPAEPIQTASAGETIPAPAQPAGGGAPAAAPRPSRPKPVDVLTFLARNGGLRDTDGHNLKRGFAGRGMSQFAPGGGHVFRKGGMSIDQAGELLHEAGYFPVERPTTAEVLEMIDRAAFERVYRPRDMPDVLEQRAAEQDGVAITQAQDKVREAADAMGVEDLTDEDVAAIAERTGYGGDPYAALEAHVAERYEATAEDFYGQADTDFDVPFAPDDGASRAAARNDGAGVDRPEPDRREPGGGGEGRPAAERDPPFQTDAFGERPGDQRRALERRGDGRQQAEVSQKPPGSDGGLFDDTGARQADAFEQPQTRGEMYGEQLRQFREGKKLDPADIDRLVRGGLLEASERGRNGYVITERGQDVLRRFGGGEAGFVEVDALMAPFRAVARLAGDVADWSALKGDVAAIRRSFGEPRQALKAAIEPMQRVVSAGLFSNDARLRGLAARFDSAAIRELADHFNAEAGKGDGTGRTYHEAVQRASITRTQAVFDALEPHLAKPEAMNRIRDLLATPKRSIRATAAEREVAQKVRDILKETLDYRRDAGEAIGEVSDGYFPRLLDAEKVAKERDEFLRRAEKLYRSVGADNPKAAAQAWFEHVFDTYAGLDGGLSFTRGGSGIGGKTAQPREFGKLADELLRDFYQGDVMNVLAGYFGGAARRAEHARRFGMKGREGSVERAAWEREHKGKTQLEVLEERIKADVRASDQEPAGVLQVIDSVMQSNLGQMGTRDHFARTAVSYLHTWNQLAKMDRVTISSLGDLVMGIVRGGPRYGFTFMKDAVQETVRQIRKAPPSDAARWAEAFGVANDAFVNQILTSRAGIEGGTAGTQKVLTSFYKAVGLHQFTEGGRIAAAKMAQRMVHDFAHDLVSESPRVRSRAARYLSELGVQNPKAFGEQLRRGTPTRADVLADQDHAAEYGTAVYRAVQQTILMPSRAEKPTWSAHPVGSMLFSLMSYSYGFKKNVLDRAGRLAIAGVKERDPALLIPAFSLSVMAAFQAVNDTYLRPALFGSGYDFSEESPTEALMRVADRAGFLGAASPLVNAVKAVRYDRSLAESLSGPVMGSMLNAAQKGVIEPLSDRNSPNTNTSERNAAAAFYDAIIEPAVDGFAAARLKGVARSAAILGTGNKEGGLLPGDKSAFIDTMGGAKEGDDQ